MRQRDKYIPELENLEIELLLQGIERLHGINLQEYSFAPVRRRVWEAIRREKVRSVSALQEKLLHEPEALERFIRSILPETHPFPPGFFFNFRQELVPWLKTYPFVRIWQAGCSQAFDTYSLVIILQEEGLQDRSVLYSTDISEKALRRAQDGLFPMTEVERYSKIYQAAGGRALFTDYFCAGDESGMFDTALRKNIVFAQHHLATDSSFNEFNAIFCRSSLKVFDRKTLDRVHELLCESLVLFGILGLPPGETLDGTRLKDRFASVDQELNLYRKVE